MNSTKINLKQILMLAGFGIAVMAVTLGYFYYQELQIEKKAAQALALAKQKEQAKLAEEQRPHKEVFQMVEDLRVNGKSLPPCPLIYPLLDEKGQVSALGSYLSYFGMKQATYLPQVVFNLPNVGNVFHIFRLFDSGSSQYHDQYLKQLPFFFGTQDYAQGTLVKTKSGYHITLQFQGSHPSQKFDKKFASNQLHLAPGWMASCLHTWAGFHPSADQAAFLDSPVFGNDDDLKRAASLESLLRQGGMVFINQWDKILANNPESAYLVDRWIDILDAREQTDHLNLIEPMVQKHPENSFYKLTYVNQLYSLKKYDDVLKLSLAELKGDDDNSDWYSFAVCALEKKRYYDEAITLLKNWTQNHPNNPNAWILLATHTRYWAWEARGSDWSKNVTPEAWKIFKDRIAEGLKDAQKAADLAPLYGRAWGSLMDYGNGADITKENMQGYFEKVLELDPNDYDAYTTYLDYLEPKWNGSEEKMFDFADKYKKRFPALFSVPCTEQFQVYTNDQSEEGLAKWRKNLRNKVKNSPYWNDFSKGCRDYLLLSPGDLGEWKSYLAWAELAGKTKPILDLAKKISKKNKELKSLYPYVVLAASDAAENELETYYEKKNFIKKSSVFKERQKAYLSLLKLDSNNWDIWNRLANLEVQNKKNTDAKKALKTIGDHWVAEVWSKDDFEESRKSLGVNSN